MQLYGNKLAKTEAATANKRVSPLHLVSTLRNPMIIDINVKNLPVKT